MRIYLVIEDYGQDCGQGVIAVMPTFELAVAHIRKLNPKYKSNWPYGFEIETWEIGGTEPIDYREPGYEIAGRTLMVN